MSSSNSQFVDVILCVAAATNVRSRDSATTARERASPAGLQLVGERGGRDGDSADSRVAVLKSIPLSSWPHSVVHCGNVCVLGYLRNFGISLADAFFGCQLMFCSAQRGLTEERDHRTWIVVYESKRIYKRIVKT